ncbi:hypothetical protein [Comamonas aquatica]|uniref:hypothetical protein n=1 Tax=Comamonas aquatica TaxID=225991 RepID=UPI001F1DAB0E|nr:hypothetical protein [Comamonas aquatica]
MIVAEWPKYNLNAGNSEYNSYTYFNWSAKRADLLPGNRPPDDFFNVNNDFRFANHNKIAKCIIDGVIQGNTSACLCPNNTYYKIKENSPGSIGWATSYSTGSWTSTAYEIVIIEYDCLGHSGIVSNLSECPVSTKGVLYRSYGRRNYDKASLNKEIKQYVCLPD